MYSNRLSNQNLKLFSNIFGIFLDGLGHLISQTYGANFESFFVVLRYEIFMKNSNAAPKAEKRETLNISILPRKTRYFYGFAVVAL